MRRIVVHRPGGYDRLRVESGPDPAPGPGEVLVEVEAAGVNYADCLVRMGLYATARRRVGFPITPGFEVAGRIGAVGPGVSRRSVGDRVLSMTLFDGYASRLVVPEERILPVPEGMATVEAATFPTVFLTAWHAMFELARPEDGSAILVHSAAGGVGTALTQLGRLAGCRVVAVVGGPYKVEAARDAGADHVIDKSSENLWDQARSASPDGYAAVFDANGVTTLAGSYRSLAPGGRLVVYGFHGMLPRGRGRASRLKLAWHYLRTPRFDPLRMTMTNRSVMAFNLSVLESRARRLREGLVELLGWYGEGRVRPAPVTTFPFDDVARAHAALESGRTVGKLALVLE